MESSIPVSHPTPPFAGADRRLLSQLGVGLGRVLSVEGDAADVARLMAMGICYGRRIEVLKQGDPLIVKVVGARVGLSARLAAHVVVTSFERAVDSVSAA